MPGKAAIDNDFLNHLLEIKNHPDLPDLIRRFFIALDVSVFMHPFVYKCEAIVITNKVRDILVEDRTISIPELSDIWDNKDGGKMYYEMMVRGIYKDFTGNEYPCNNMFEQWVARQSLGEVHTVVACAFVMSDCFLSDDRGASELQTIVFNRFNRPVHVYNRHDRCDYLRSIALPKNQGLTSKELKMISHPVNR